MEIKNYVVQRYAPVSGSLTDIIAVKSGIKPVARLSCLERHYSSIKKTFGNEGLRVEISEKALGSEHYLYLSKSAGMARDAKKHDYSFRYHGMSAEEIKRNLLRFGKILGYPECCSEFLADNMDLPAKNFPDKFVPKNEISFYFNNLLNGFSNHSLSFHQPCSYNCRASGKYLKGIYRAVMREEPRFREELDRYLKYPYMVIFNPEFQFSNAWETRKGFCFDGYVKNNTIHYGDSVFFRTEYPEYDNDVTDDEIEKLKTAISMGNKVMFGKNSVYVHRDNGLLGEFKNSGNSHKSLFVFV